MSKLLLALISVTVLAGCGAPITTVATTSPTAVEAERAYNILDMQGIGPVYATKLRAAGLTNTDKFLAATQDRKARQELADKTGISYARILHWARKAELMRINGIGVKQADLLEAVGVDSVKELAQRNADNLAERLATANAFAPAFVKRTPSLTTVGSWIAAAKQLNTDDPDK